MSASLLVLGDTGFVGRHITEVAPGLVNRTSVDMAADMLAWTRAT